MPINEADIEEEQAHFANVITTFQQYASYAVRLTFYQPEGFTHHGP